MGVQLLVFTPHTHTATPHYASIHILQELFFKMTLEHRITLGKKATIQQVATMLATSKNVLYPGFHNHHANHRYRWPDTLIG